jgi:hypothetical protein
VIAVRMVDFSGGKKLKRVENTVGKLEDEKLSIYYYRFFNVYLPG